MGLLKKYKEKLLIGVLLNNINPKLNAKGVYKLTRDIAMGDHKFGILIGKHCFFFPLHRPAYLK